jgi:hypothetical protein
MTRKLVYITLLYLANQLGRKISKLSLTESEYFRAINVRGQILQVSALRDVLINFLEYYFLHL